MNGKIAILSFVLLALHLSSCIKSDGPLPPKDNTPVIPDCSGSPGPLFTEVKNLVAQKCLQCHNNNSASGGVNFQVECNIVSKKDRIKIRAVDEGSMPPNGPLSPADKSKITAWIIAGGQHSN